MLNELCSHVGMVVGGGGDALIPCLSSGLVYDLIDFIRNYLNTINLQSTNLYFVSPVANHSLAYSNISSEWLCSNKQQRAFVAEAPFSHQSMVKTKQLFLFDGVDKDFANTLLNNRANPCVIFCGHPCMRFGDILHLIKIMSAGAKNALISIDGDLTSFDKLVSPFLTPDTKMRFVNCPIDLKLKRSEIVQLLKEIAPRKLAISRQVQSSIDTKSIKNSVGQIVVLEAGVPSHIQNNKRKFEQAHIMPDLAKQITPRQVKGCHVSRVVGCLEARDGDYRLTKRTKNTSLEDTPGELFGDQIKIDLVVRALQSQGYEVNTVPLDNDRFGTYQIDIPMIDSRIIFSPDRTNVEAPNSELRKHLKTTLMKNYVVL
ncbi:hypothetical protein AKO1_003250 [Acrasis kona]|uniref:Beta-Casp domain-containing protein n=1 Tax=Acrasis kona TaxID=1008807 RepID=A0AAW2Z8U8_9EUKA